jgi:hypothetical protein
MVPIPGPPYHKEKEVPGTIITARPFEVVDREIDTGA